MALSRRTFVRTVGIGAAGAFTSSIMARGRENAIWSAFEPTLDAQSANTIIISSIPAGNARKMATASSSVRNFPPPDAFS